MTIPRRRASAGLAAAALFTLAACGGGSGTDNTADNGEKVGAGTGKGGEAGSTKNADLQGPAEVPSDAAQGGTVTVLTANVPSTLDPTQAYYTDSTAILSDLVTRSLTQFVYNPETNDMQLVPDMATDLGQPNEDNTEWTFTLKDGLKYEDGSDVKAEDIAYAV
ncbi:MAG: ABC transporter substrate-binding protein, partial [Nocardioides sp.]